MSKQLMSEVDVEQPQSISPALESLTRTSPALADALDRGALSVASVEELCSTEGIEIAPRSGAVLVLFQAWRERTTRLSPPTAPVALEQSKDAASLPQFQGGEHTYLGNHARIHFPGADQTGSVPLPLPNGLRLSYGQILALAGDFYGLVNLAISEDPNPPVRFLEAFHSLASAKAAVSEVPQILAIMQVEINAVNAAIKNGKQPSSAYAALGDSLDRQWNVLTGGGSVGTDIWPFGRYLALADTNYDHFGQHAVQAYSIGHQVALAKALEARNAKSNDLQIQLLSAAYTLNAFADHFLTDLFASGHLRTPRQQLSNVTVIPALGSYCAGFMHGEDNCSGLYVSNKRGKTWKAYGDDRLLDKANAENLLVVQGALQKSIDEVYNTFTAGHYPTSFAALEQIPDLAKVSDYTDRTNPSALFIKMEGSVLRRVDLNNRHDYHWQSFVALTTAATLKNIPNFTGCGESDLPIELDLNIIRLRNSHPQLELTLISPLPGGGYDIWVGNDFNAGTGSSGWLSVNVNLETRIVQPWIYNDGRVALTIFAPDGKKGYKVAWSHPLNCPGDSIQWLACKAGPDQTNLVQLRDVNGLLGITTYVLDTDRDQVGYGYRVLWQQHMIDPHAGAAAKHWFTCKGSNNTTNLLQIWNDGGHAAMVLYASGPVGYYLAWSSTSSSTDLGPIDAVAWLTLEAEGDTHIIRVRVDPDPSSNNGFIIDRFSPEGKAYALKQTSKFQSLSAGPWFSANFTRNTQDLVHLWEFSGQMASEVFRWPLDTHHIITDMGIDYESFFSSITAQGDDGTERLVVFRNINNNLGLAAFNPIVSNTGDHIGDYYQLSGRKDNLGIPADSTITFFAAEKLI
jgi:hypothetical protein